MYSSSVFTSSFLFFLFYYCSVASYVPGTIDFPHISDDFSIASLIINDLDLGIDDIEFTQTGVGVMETGAETSTVIGVTKTARTNGGASSHPSSSQSHPHLV